MVRTSRWAWGLTSCLTLCWATGCSVETKTTSGAKPGAGAVHKDDHEKGHDHAHDHAKHGPHGGHIVEIGEDEYHAEWTHDDDSGTVTVYILDGEMAKEVPIAAAEIEIETQIADQTNTYKLAAANANEGDKPTASRFEIENKSLAVVLHAAGSEGTSATLKVTIQDKPFTAKFEQHEHQH